jgi:putative transcriptional regulator
MGGNQMSRKAFEAIAAGLQDAIAHARGKGGRGRIRKVRLPEVNVAAVRAKLKLSQEDFAAAFGVSLGTVRNWEQGRRQPDGPARALLVVISKAPKTVMEALGVVRHGNKAA